MSESANSASNSNNESEMPALEQLTPLDFAAAFEPKSNDDSVKATFQKLYNGINDRLDATRHGNFSYFLNYGYAPDESPSFAVQVPKVHLNKNSIRLVLETIGHCDVSAKRVLDVGCGRGGTVYALKAFFRPGAVSAVDLSPKAIEFCRNVHKYPKVSFEQGDAENLPFPDQSFDIVTNIESSHSYPRIERFYSEVGRVLDDFGQFLYTDIIPTAEIDHRLDLLQNAGLVCEQRRDITQNVLASCDQIAEARIAVYGVNNDMSLMQNFLATPGSLVYENLSRRLWTYAILQLRREKRN